MLCGRHLKHKLYRKKYLEFNPDIHYGVTSALLKAAMLTNYTTNAGLCIIETVPRLILNASHTHRCPPHSNFLFAFLNFLVGTHTLLFALIRMDFVIKKMVLNLELKECLSKGYITGLICGYYFTSSHVVLGCQPLGRWKKPIADISLCLSADSC